MSKYHPYVYLEVTDLASGKVIHRIDVSEKSVVQRLTAEMGMIRQMNKDKYAVGEQSYPDSQPLNDLAFLPIDKPAAK